MDKEDLRTAVQRMDTYQFGQKKELNRKLGKVTSYVTKQEVLNMVSQLDKEIEEVKPTLPVIPQFVAETIEKYKENDESLGELLASVEHANIKYYHNMEKYRVDFDNLYEPVVDLCAIIARAWLDGYKIESKPYWIVKLDKDRYVDNLVENAIGIEIDIAGRLDCTAPIRFKNKAKAEAVALLVNGTVEEVSE